MTITLMSHFGLTQTLTKDEDSVYVYAEGYNNVADNNDVEDDEIDQQLTFAPAEEDWMKEKCTSCRVGCGDRTGLHHDPNWWLLIMVSRK